MSLLDEFSAAIDDAMEKEASSLADGGASDYSEYRFRVGIRRGLRKALQILDDVLEAHKKAEEKF
jgi:hypothetical protein